MATILRVESLPPDIGLLLAAADGEGLGMVARLVETFQNGANRFDREGEGLWEARDQAQLVGICGLNVDPFADAVEQAGRVRRLYVSPERRRRGVASRLLDQVEEFARRHHEIVTAFTTDPQAAALYRSRGYRSVVGVTKRSFQLDLR